MNFVARDYKAICDDFDKTTAMLCGKHNVADKSELGVPRRPQILFIYKAKEVLDASDKQDSTKSQILTGLMLLERAIIAKSYGEDIIVATQNKAASSEKSMYFRCLGANMGIKDDNELELEDYESLIGKARHFIASLVYVDGLSRNGFKREHAFSEIKELDISECLRMCADVFSSAQHKVLDRNLAKQTEELCKEKAAQEKGKASGGSWLSFSALWAPVSGQSASQDGVDPKVDPKKEVSGEPATATVALSQ